MDAQRSGRRWFRRVMLLGVFAGTLVSVRAIGFALNRGRAASASPTGAGHAEGLSTR